MSEAAGRFQIYQFEYNNFIQGNAYKNTAVFRIDSQTGETWKYLDVLIDGRATSRWMKVD